MAANKPGRVKIVQRLTGEPVVLNGRIIQPVAQATGWRWAGGRSPAGFTGALLRVQPLEILVHEGETVRAIPVIDPVASGVRAVLLPAGLVALVCSLVMVVVQRLAARS